MLYRVVGFLGTVLVLNAFDPNYLTNVIIIDSPLDNLLIMSLAIAISVMIWGMEVYGMLICLPFELLLFHREKVIEKLGLHKSYPSRMEK